MAASPRTRLAAFVATLPEPQGRPTATFTVRRCGPARFVVDRRLTGSGVARCEFGRETFGPFADPAAVIAFTAGAAIRFADANPEFVVVVDGVTLSETSEQKAAA